MSRMTTAGPVGYSDEYGDVSLAPAMARPITRGQDPYGNDYICYGVVPQERVFPPMKFDKPDDGILASDGDIFDVLSELIGSIEAPEDWSSEHDHYLYNVPKTTNAEANDDR